MSGPTPAIAAVTAVDDSRKTALSLHVLGPLAIGDGRVRVTLPAARTTSLLSKLLLRANEVVSADQLTRAVWGDEAPSSSRSALQTCVRRLRLLFVKYDLPDDLVECVSTGYRVNVDATSLDLLHFRSLWQEACRTADPQAELGAIEQALSLWTGDPLANVDSDVIHRDEVPRLTDEWIRAAERRFEICLMLGRERQTLPELRRVALTYRGHERFAELLVESLYRAGRRSDALDECRSIKAYLRDELGLEASLSLQRLEQAILRGEEATTATTRPSALGVREELLEALAAHGFRHSRPDQNDMNELVRRLTSMFAPTPS